jgi:hypothetical protein
MSLVVAAVQVTGATQGSYTLLLILCVSVGQAHTAEMPHVFAAGNDQRLAGI